MIKSDAMEDIKRRLDEIQLDLKDIKLGQSELVKQGAVHNHILAQHERRSTNLEARVLPLEDAEKFRGRLFTLLMGSAGVLAIPTAVLTTLKLLGKL